MALNDLGKEIFARPITVARISFPDLDVELEAKEAAQRIATNRIIRQGRDAWEQIAKSNSFETWMLIGRALCIGKAWAMQAANANTAWGSAYSRQFGEWMAKHGLAR